MLYGYLALIPQRRYQYSAEVFDTKTLNYNTETCSVENLFHPLEILAYSIGERTLYFLKVIYGVSRKSTPFRRKPLLKYLVIKVKFKT